MRGVGTQRPSKAKVTFCDKDEVVTFYSPDSAAAAPIKLPLCRPRNRLSDDSRTRVPARISAFKSSSFHFNALSQRLAWPPRRFQRAKSGGNETHRRPDAPHRSCDPVLTPPAPLAMNESLILIAATTFGLTAITYRPRRTGCCEMTTLHTVDEA